MLAQNPLTHNGKKVFAVVEPPDSIKPLTRAAGKFYGILEQGGIDKAHVKGEYKTDRRNPAKSCFIARQIHGVARPLLLAMYCEESGWDLQPDAWAAMSQGQLTYQEALTNLTA